MDTHLTKWDCYKRKTSKHLYMYIRYDQTLHRHILRICIKIVINLEFGSKFYIIVYHYQMYRLINKQICPYVFGTRLMCPEF